MIVGASRSRAISPSKGGTPQLARAHSSSTGHTMKVEFLATLSHELRTPLNAILGWVQILKNGATADDLAAGVPIIERNVRAQAQLIEDLLDMSRIEAGKVSLDIQPVDLAEIVDASIETVRPATRGKEIRLTPPSQASVGLSQATEIGSSKSLEPADQCRESRRGRSGSRRHERSNSPCRSLW